MQLRKAGSFRKSLGQHFGAQARTAHAEHDGIAEFLPFDALCVVLVVGSPVVFGGGARQPAQPFVFIGTCPDRFIALPQSADGAGGAPFFGGGGDRLRHAAAERQCLLPDRIAQDFRALVCDSAKQLVGGIGEELHAFLHKVAGDGIERNPAAREVGQYLPCLVHVLFKAVAQFAVIAERIEGCRGDGVDRVLADQLLDIENVTVVLVLGAGRGPQ